jgi:hypothetical protein
MVRAGSGEVVVDVTDAALTRLLELLDRPPVAARHAHGGDGAPGRR